MVDNPSTFDVSESRAQNEAELIRVWNRLEPYADWKPSSRILPPALALPSEREVLERWSNLFREEIDLVRRARNTVVHTLPAPDEQIEGAVEVGRKLWDLLQTGVTGVREPKVTEWLFQLHRYGRPWDKRPEDVDWQLSAVGSPVPFTAVQFGASAWQAQGPVEVVAAEDLAEPAWTVSRPGEDSPTMTGLVGHSLATGDRFVLPVMDIIGNVPRI